MNTHSSSLQVKPVMVGVNGSHPGPVLVDFAVAEAVLLGVPLVVTHVWPGRYTGAFRGRGAVPSPADAQRLLTLSAERARMIAPSLAVSTELLDGGAGDVLSRATENASLLVVGHREEAHPRSAWGSTTAYLAHHTACPLMIYRGSVPADGPVVVSASARLDADATLAYAFARARQSGASLVAVHMWMRPGAQDGVPPVVAAGGYAQEQAAAERTLTSALAPLVARFPDVAVERLVVHDRDMANTLERALRRGRLMVAGTGRSGAFAEILCGAADSRIGRRSTCPTVLIPSALPARAGAGRGAADGVRGEIR
ncbi:MAG: universal stress protein [Actinomycetota bacterium]|nr:universal stress protein [Actinomycetota bacterium]